MSDDRMREFVLSCLKAHPDILFLKGGEKIDSHNHSDIMTAQGAIDVAITEDKLWLSLTGYTKKECSIGGLAFELLLEIAKAKDTGINTMELARKTKQDPRSITGRIKKLGNLVSGVQVIYKGHVVKLLKLRKLAFGEMTTKPYVNIRDYLPTIVDVVKKSKNGVRQLIDLKRELKFDKDKRLSKSFIAAIAWLDEKEYLKKVLVVSPTNPAIKIRCVKYLRDYASEEKTSNDFEDDSDDNEDDVHDNSEDKGGLEEEEAFEGLDSFNATSLLQDQNLIVQESTKGEKKEFMINRFYPMQNQTFGLVAKHGTAGLSTMETVNTITGKDYKRSFTKSSESYIDSVGKQKKDSNGFGLVRVYDFEGKKKFYRLFTESNFRTLSGTQEPPDLGSFKDLKEQKKTICELNDKNYVPLNNTLRFISRNDEDHFFWYGDLKVPVSDATKAKKRKKTDTSEESLKRKKHVRNSPGTTKDKQKSPTDKLELSTGVSVSAEESNSNNSMISIDGFSASSLKSLQRQRAILEIIKRNGGVTFFRDQLFEDVTKFMRSQTLLDKKTIRGDVNLLVASKKLNVNVDPSTGKRILYLPGVTEETIRNYITDDKDNKKAYFTDVIQSTDIYFFDHTEKNRFHRGVKSAERVRKFQKSSRKEVVADSSIQSKKRVGKSRSQIKTKDASLSAQKGATTSQKNNSESVSFGYASPTTTATETAPELGYKVRKNHKTAQKEKGSTNYFNVGSKEGARALVMAIVISKSIKGQILWDFVTKLFPNNSLDNLKKQWTIRRVRMGHSGWKAQIEKWRKIMVEAVKDERATLEDAECLNLLKLIRLWMEVERNEKEKPIKLYKNHQENYKRYTLLKDASNTRVRHGLAMSSMVQRESYLLKKTYTYENNARETYSLVEDEIRSVIRSILIGNNAMDTEEIDVLQNFSKDDVDKVILDMAKERQLSFVDSSKLQLTDIIFEFLQTKGNYEFFEKTSLYRRNFLQMLNSNKAIVVSSEVSNHAACVLIDLLESREIKMFEVLMPIKEKPMHYTTRKYEVGALTPPLLCTGNGVLAERQIKKVPIPLGKPFSCLWIDSQGNIRNEIWNKLVAITINEILFNPGINLETLVHRYHKVVSLREMKDIVQWFINSNVIKELSFGGLFVNCNWYAVFQHA